MIKFVMLCGPSASGKDYIVEHSFSDYEHIASDNLREEMFGDATYQGDNGTIFSEMEKRTIAALKAGKSVVYNATNINSKKRAALLKQLQKENYSTTVYYECFIVNTPFSTCLGRNAARDRKVPEDVIKRQIMNFQMPLYSEGWDNIEIIAGKTLTNVERLNLANKVQADILKIKNQFNPHHSLSLAGHLERTAKLIPHLEDKEAYMDLYLAAQLHDAGKPYCQTFDEKNVAHYRDHQYVSSFIAMNLGFNLRTCQLIAYHMALYDKKGLNTWRAKLGEELFQLVSILHEADKGAH